MRNRSILTSLFISSVLSSFSQEFRLQPNPQEIKLGVDMFNIPTSVNIKPALEVDPTALSILQNLFNVDNISKFNIIAG